MEPEANNQIPRYAVYFAPSGGSPLETLGNSWLGRNAETLQTVDPGLPSGISAAEWRSIVKSPCRYGFHATLKPPFRPSASVTFDGVQRAFEEFASMHAAFLAPPLRVRQLGHFLALTLSEPSGDFHRLAAASVADFDCLRASPTDQELARRLDGSLSAREREHVMRWGYPYVFDTWQFHMTLTGALPSAPLASLERYLTQRFEPVTQEPWLVDSVCLFREPFPNAHFELVSRAALRSA